MVLVGKKRPKVFDGGKLQALRNSAELTQSQLARKAGVNAMDVSRYERGLTVPSFDVVCRLADALGVGIEEFRSDTDAE